MKALKRKDGRLTRYGLSCGYVERHKSGAVLGYEHGYCRVYMPMRKKWVYCRTMKAARHWFARAKREV